MTGSFVYKPPLTAIYLPQDFYPAHQHFYVPWHYYPFYPHLLSPYTWPSYLAPRRPFPEPPLTVSTPGQSPLPALQPEDITLHRFPPPRSQSVPAEHGPWVPDPPRLGRCRRPSVERNQGPRVNDRVPSYNPSYEPIRDPSALLTLNPWINADNHLAPLTFDLSLSKLAPRMYTNGQRVRFTEMELMQPATHPPRTRISIHIPAIPQWPCDILPRAGAMSSITLRDVFYSLYKHLHQRSSYLDWDLLLPDTQEAVTQAFMKRCSRHADTRTEMLKGVKRVDFLLEKTKMVGLRWYCRRDGCEIMELILSA